MYEHQGRGALDYHPCHYGKSKLLFRGPKQQLNGAFCTVIGGTETYGKFIETPFPMLVEERTGHKVVNLGCVNAGVDVFARDHSVQEICESAQVTVMQALGAQNLSNRFYVVHPRRNDRFLRASALLKSLFQDVDFTEFHFTRHMLTTLKLVSRDRFALVEAELKTAWSARMQYLAERIPGKTVLLHLTAQRPAQRMQQMGLGCEPLFITDEMVCDAGSQFSETLRVIASQDAMALGTEGMIFNAMEEPAASQIPGPAVHREVADALTPVIARLMG